MSCSDIQYMQLHALSLVPVRECVLTGAQVRSAFHTLREMRLECLEWIHEFLVRNGDEVRGWKRGNPLCSMV